MELLTQDDGGLSPWAKPCDSRPGVFIFILAAGLGRPVVSREVHAGRTGLLWPSCVSLEGGRAEEGRLVVYVGGGGETRRYTLERSRAASSQSSQSKEAKQRQHQTVVSSAPRRCVSHMTTFAVYHGAIPNGAPGR
jgi:hypothetical protein